MDTEQTNPTTPADPAATPAAAPAPEPTSPTPAPAAPAPAEPASPPAELAPVAEIPPVDAPTAPSAEAPAAATTGSGGTHKILLVEDDDNLASVYLTRLQNENFDAKRVPNGEDALAAAIEYKPDLILLDVMMPKVSGFDVLDILRNTPETAKTKIIMLTALSQEADKQKAEQLGVSDYLVKSQVVIADVIDRIKFNLGV